MQVIELPAERIDELRVYLAKDPVQNLYALGVLEEHGLAVGDNARVCAYGLYEERKLVGAVILGGRGALTLPCVFDPGAASEIGRELSGRVRIRSVLGERSAVDALLRAANCGPARWSRPQRLFAASADDLGPFVCSSLRLARRADIPELLSLSAVAVKEFVGEDPTSAGAGLMQRRVEARVVAGRSYLLTEGARTLVKVDIGVRSRYGAEIEELFTIPSERHKDHATNVLGQLSRITLAAVKLVTLRVDEREAGLAAVCRKVGFTAMRPQRLVVLG